MHLHSKAHSSTSVVTHTEYSYNLCGEAYLQILNIVKNFKGNKQILLEQVSESLLIPSDDVLVHSGTGQVMSASIRDSILDVLELVSELLGSGVLYESNYRLFYKATDYEISYDSIIETDTNLVSKESINSLFRINKVKLSKYGRCSTNIVSLGDLHRGQPHLGASCGRFDEVFNVFAEMRPDDFFYGFPYIKYASRDQVLMGIFKAKICEIREVFPCDPIVLFQFPCHLVRHYDLFDFMVENSIFLDFVSRKYESSMGHLHYRSSMVNAIVFDTMFSEFNYRKELNTTRYKQRYDQFIFLKDNSKFVISYLEPGFDDFYGTIPGTGIRSEIMDSGFYFSPAKFHRKGIFIHNFCTLFSLEFCTNNLIGIYYFKVANNIIRSFSVMNLNIEGYDDPRVIDYFSQFDNRKILGRAKRLSLRFWFAHFDFPMSVTKHRYSPSPTKPLDELEALMMSTGNVNEGDVFEEFEFVSSVTEKSQVALLAGEYVNVIEEYGSVKFLVAARACKELFSVEGDSEVKPEYPDVYTVIPTRTRKRVRGSFKFKDISCSGDIPLCECQFCSAKRYLYLLWFKGLPSPGHVFDNLFSVFDPSLAHPTWVYEFVWSLVSDIPGDDLNVLF
jgi:hypothetical protein